MTDTTKYIPENAAHDCPGANTETAGKASACEGCPNKGVCSTGAGKANMEQEKQEVHERLKNIRKKLFVLSGKGGVGKSTMTMLIGRYLSTKYRDLNFGVLDLDICGPSQPRMLGVEGEQIHSSGSGWSPVNVDDNLCLMSIGFLLSSPDDAIIWRGPKKNNIIKQFLSNVDWGDEMDILLIDTPPGTSDEHMSSFSFLNSDRNDTGAIIVTTPQEVSLLDVRKQISFCRRFNIPIIGVIENMSIYHCRICNKTSEIFPSNTGGAKKMCDELSLTYLGNFPLDGRLTELCDKGLGDEFANNLNSDTVECLNLIAEEVMKFCL